MHQCQCCHSYDVERVHRKFFQRLWMRRLSVCNQCGNVQKIFKYDFLNKADTAENK